ncbi:MAG TPA: glucuronate isomerase [Gemmatimonas sp.]|uniref:glucuronate isomerase n=1 Tax=Gemmatimonas sp. TaxID=1962908 RepID=UPI002EDA91FB
MHSTSGAEPLVLHPERFFDADPAIRRVAVALYEETHALPIISPHGHVDPWLLANNEPFPEPTALLLTPDHYIFRMLYSQGVSMESLGIPTRDGTPVETDARRIWQRFAEHYHLFRGTPTGVWFDHELHELFGVRLKLGASTATAIYDQIAERLMSAEFRPRALFDRFNIEVLATTDAAGDTLDAHRQIRASGWAGQVVPTFRPDAVFRIATPVWRDAITALEQVTGRSIGSYAAFIDALVQQRAFFRSLGATATDHAVVAPYTERLDTARAEALFAAALQGRATAADQQAFEAHMLMEMARMSCHDGLVMQLHPGSFRDHHTHIVDRFGQDKGADIPVATEYTRNLHALLNAYGAHPNFTLVLFTLDETTYARELAPIAGHYPAVRLGPPWWFHDSLEGMRRFREQVTETAGLWNTTGFIDDTRAFCSIPARHDLARRMDANYLGGLVARHQIDMSDARQMARALAYDLGKRAYRFTTGS